MDSRTWMYQQVGPASQAAAQSSQETMRYQQRVNSSHQYQTPNTAVPVYQDPQRWRMNWKSLAAYNQAASSGQRSHQNYRRTSYGNHQSLSTMVSNGSQVSTLLAPHQNYPQNSSTTLTANPPHAFIQNGFYQNANGGSAQTRTLTSSTNERVSRSNVPPAAPHLSHRQISVHNGFSPAIAPPSYHTATAQASTSQSVADRSRLILSKTRLGRLLSMRPSAVNPSPETMEQMMIARIEEDLRQSVPVGLDGCWSDHHSSQQQPAEGHNSHVHQSSPLISASSQPETSPMSRSLMHQSMAAAPPHAPDFYGRAAGGGVRNYFLPANNQTSSGNQGGAVKAASQVMNGHAQSSSYGMRAVAVVPPLSQESQPDATKHCNSPVSSKEAEWSTMKEPACGTNINNNETQDWTESPVNQEKPKNSTDQHQLCTEDTGPVQVTNAQPASAPITAAAEAPASFVELSSIPTVECTLETLEKLIAHLNGLQSAQVVNSPFPNKGQQILDMFWGGDHSMCFKHMRDVYNPIINTAKQYCQEHLKKNTVVASRVKKAHLKSLEDHDTLQHDDRYTEPPYKSTWLNVNEQVDDIDQLFGVPWPLRRRAHTPDSDVGLDDEEILNFSAQLRCNSPFKESSQTEPEPADTGVEHAVCTDEEASTPTEDPSNPLHSLEYEVLPLEEAIAIFERAGRDANILPETAEDRSVEAEVLKAPPSEENLMSVGPIEEVCCIQRLKLILNGSNSNETQCQCQKQQTSNENIQQTFKEVVAQLKKDEVYVMELDGSVTKVRTVESMDTQTTEESNILTDMLNSSLPSITLMHENEKDGLSTGGHPEQTEDLQKDSERAQETVSESSAVNGVQVDNQVDGEQDPSPCAVEESCGLASTDVGGSSLETTKEAFEAVQQTSLNLSRKPHRLSLSLKRSAKHLVSEDSHSAFQDVSKRSTSSAGGEPFVSCHQTVKLTLFGLPKHDKLDLTVGRRHFSTSKAPEVLSVILSPLKKRSSAPDSAGESSLKRRIHEKWRESIPQRQGELNTSSSGMKLKTPEKAGVWKQPIVSARWSHKRLKRLLPKVTKQRKEKSKRDVAAHKKPAYQRIGDAENRKYSVKPLHGQNILVFSVLPKSFNFQDGSQETENPEEPAPNETARVEEQSLNQTVPKKQGSWKNPNQVKKCSPLRRDSSSVFLDFQKKYLKKRQQE